MMLTNYATVQAIVLPGILMLILLIKHVTLVYLLVKSALILLSVRHAMIISILTIMINNATKQEIVPMDFIRKKHQTRLAILVSLTVKSALIQLNVRHVMITSIITIMINNVIVLAIVPLDFSR
jgi:hypothetical protein